MKNAIPFGLLALALLIASLAPLRNRVSRAVGPMVAQVDHSLQRRFPALTVMETLWRARAPEAKPLATPRACSQADAFTSC
ncbi:MAG: hypothetical protein ACRD1E_02210 [Terriglobales bacterium]